jgi:DNA-binding SARP family transcriptional activator
MTARLAALTRSLAALAVVLVTMTGPPLALVSYIGWPLPRSIPTLDGLDHAARTGISDHLIINTLAVLAWIAWAQIALAIAAEITAVARRRPARRLPVFPGVQALAARLVAGAFLMTSPLHISATPVLAMPITATATPAPYTAPLTPQAVAARGPVESSYAPAIASATVGEPRGVTVERHDSYWAIAERCLNGNGLRWREIRDLNVGRTMPDGTTITPDSDLLRPGWTLHLPATATDPVKPAAADASSAVPGASAVDPGEITVVSGDSFWSLAEEQLTAALGRAPTDSEIDPYWRELIDANADRLVEPGNPNLLHPGQRLVTPRSTPDGNAPPRASAPEPDPGPELDPTPTPASQDPPVSEDTPTTTVPAPAPATATPPSDLDPVTTTSAPDHARPAPAIPSTTTSIHANRTDSHTGSALPAVALAGSISAAVAVGTLQALRRRRRRAAHRHPTLAPRPTNNEPLHRTLILEADETALDRLGSVLDQLAVDVAATGAQCRPRVVQHHTTHVELLVDQPADPPEGWQADGLLWTFDIRNPPPIREAIVYSVPLLVTLGLPDAAGQVYLDLEAEGIVSLTGDPASVRHLVTAILAELALSPLADRISVLTVGDLNAGALAGLDHVTTHGTWDDITDDITSWAEQTHDAHITNRWPNTFVARGAAPDHDAVAPLVVIADRPPPGPLLQHLIDHRPASIALVIAAAIDQPATVIDCQPEVLTIPALGLTCTPHPLETATVEAIVDLLDDASEPADQPLIIATDLPAHLPLIGDDEEPTDNQEVMPEVLVRLLGDIRVDAAGERLAAKQTAVIAYVALHRTVTVERLTDAIWAQPSTGSRKRLANTISDCRSVIGHRYLPTAIEGRYSAGLGLQTDTDQFTRLVTRAATEPPADAAATLRAALDLITGPVFTYRHSDRSSFSWVDLENLASIWELKIAAVAQHCAELYLDLEKPRDAATTAQHALTIIPTHSGLTETLMRAHAAAGDDHAVRRVYQAHLAALAALDLDDPDESTSNLYDELRQGATTRA